MAQPVPDSLDETREFPISLAGVDESQGPFSAVSPVSFFADHMDPRPTAFQI